jgi:hypothetical protein
MKTITINQAVDYLYERYAKFGASREIIQNAMEQGVTEFNLSPLSAFNTLRASLGEHFEVEELFTLEDLSEISGMSLSEVQQEVEKAIDELNAEGADLTEYFKPIEQPRRFIVAPNSWK